MVTHLLDCHRGSRRNEFYQGHILPDGTGICSSHMVESLRHDSIHSWEDLKKLFIDNFQGSIYHPATRPDLRLCKQERGEALRSYIRRFFDTHATIANIANDDVIDYFHNGLATQQLYCDFGRNRPRSVVALRDMMLGWADQEEQECDRLPRRDDNNQKHN